MPCSESITSVLYRPEIDETIGRGVFNTRANPKTLLLNFISDIGVLQSDVVLNIGVIA